MVLLWQMTYTPPHPSTLWSAPQKGGKEDVSPTDVKGPVRSFGWTNQGSQQCVDTVLVPRGDWAYEDRLQSLFNCRSCDYITCSKYIK